MPTDIPPSNDVNDAGLHGFAFLHHARDEGINSAAMADTTFDEGVNNMNASST